MSSGRPAIEQLSAFAAFEPRADPAALLSFESSSGFVLILDASADSTAFY